MKDGFSFKTGHRGHRGPLQKGFGAFFLPSCTEILACYGLFLRNVYNTVQVKDVKLRDMNGLSLKHCSRQKKRKSSVSKILKPDTVTKNTATRLNRLSPKYVHQNRSTPIHSAFEMLPPPTVTFYETPTRL